MILPNIGILNKEVKQKLENSKKGILSILINIIILVTYAYVYFLFYQNMAEDRVRKSLCECHPCAGV
jgi:hypothetical protein